MIGDFHFIRPWLLLALVPLAVLIWTIHRHQDVSQSWRRLIAPHLLPFLLQGQSVHTRFTPLLLIGTAWFITVISISGPTWRHEPAPFAEDTAALAIVVKVAPSMLTEDVQPNRLSRSVQKIHDLLTQRPGSKTALIAYAGSAHVVMPLTSDGGIINSFAEALDPRIMPVDGDVTDQAFALADQVLASSGSGSILWITDSLASEQVAPLSTWRKRSAVPVRLLPAVLPGDEFEALSNSARTVNPSITTLTPDDGDVTALARAAKFSSAATGELSNRWQECGYWLTPLIAALLLPFFRKGWMVQTAARL